MRARVSSRQSPRSRIRWSMSREAGFPVACSRLLIPARTGASPSAFAICGLPPARSSTGLASLAPGLAFAPGFAGPLAFVPAFAVFVALAAGLRPACTTFAWPSASPCSQSSFVPFC